MKTVKYFLAAVFVFSLACVVWGSVPNKMSYEGRLTDASGNAVTTAKTVEFKIYDSLTGGTLVWGPESISVTPDSQGVFSVILGNTTPITQTVFNSSSKYLEITVGGETLSPRTQIVSVGYSFMAAMAQSVEDGSITKNKAASGNFVKRIIAGSGVSVSGDEGTGVGQVTISSTGGGQKGDKGDTGNTGPQGIQGLTGATGASGETGAAGAIGAQGVKGDTGNTGAQGIQGLTGATGASGETGAAGAIGAQGVKGDTGNTGAQGIQGLTGATGASGETGAAGAIGAQGVKGDTGNTGAQGIQGLTGATGATGETGAAGAIGAQGVKGDTGNTGAQGIQGPTGEAGTGSVIQVNSGSGLTGGPISTTGTISIDSTVVPRLGTANTFTNAQTAPNFLSNVATGTQPYATTSTTLNTNLNAALVQGKFIQSGTVTCAKNSSASVVLPTAYTTATYSVVVSIEDSNKGAIVVVDTSTAKSTTGFTVNRNNTGAANSTVDWITIGTP